MRTVKGTRCVSTRDGRDGRDGRARRAKDSVISLGSNRLTNGSLFARAALSGFTRLDVIDMDTIDVTNLNRQFLFRNEDVGASKAETAARRVRERVRGCLVTPHHGRIEDKQDDWYRQFDIIALGLDSLEARAYINAVCCGFLEYDEEGNVDPSTIKPLVDGGTEGFKGHARVIVPGMTPCFNCTMWLFPPQTTFPLCTLAETPRNAAHCIEYARLIQWPAERFGETFDPDVAEHMMWVYTKALKRAETFGILGVTYAHTQGVTKNIIPAIPSTNAIIAAACVIETLKMATMCAKGMNNYMMYVGTDGVYSHTVEYERDPSCVVCSPGIAHSMSVDATLEDFMASLVLAHPDSLAKPSVSFGGKNLYLRGVLESEFKENLTERMSSLMGNRTDGLIIVNDKKRKKSMRVRLSLKE